jgi:hypothetical protein
MVTFAKKATLAIALAASALATATPAMADPYHRGRGGDTAGAAIAGGIIGIALGAIIASASNNNRSRDYADRRYDGRYDSRYRGQPTWNGSVYSNGGTYNGQYDQRYRGGYQPGYSRDGYPQGNDGYYDRRGYREYQGRENQAGDDRARDDRVRDERERDEQNRNEQSRAEIDRDRRGN